MGIVVDVLLLLVPVLIPLFRKFLPKVLPKVAAFFGIGGLAAGAAKGTSWIVGWLRRFPPWFVGLFKAGGALYWLRSAAWLLRSVFKTPVFLTIGLVLSAFFPGLIEKLFLVVGAVSLRIGIRIMTLGKSMIDDMPENNIEQLKDIMGDSAQQLPPCMIDVLGYLHLVEDLGMIISTIVFIGLYNLIKRIYFKWL